MSQVHIILENEGGELDRQVINPDMNDEAAIGAALRKTLESGEWILAVGDTIRIVEVE
jgi:hypothetical protein